MSKNKKVLSFHTEDPAADRAFDQITEILDNISSTELLDGRIVKDIEINGVTKVEHGLGREIQGYIIVRQDTNAEVFEPKVENKNKNLFFFLQSNKLVKLSLWVF